MIAGTLWGEIWPETQENILVGCSLYEASKKVFGDKDEMSRALPLDRNGHVFFNDEKDDKVWIRNENLWIKKNCIPPGDFPKNYKRIWCPKRLRP